MKELVTGLQNDTRDVSHHLLVVQWQKSAFDALSKDVPLRVQTHMKNCRVSSTGHPNYVIVTCVSQRRNWLD